MRRRPLPPIWIRDLRGPDPGEQPERLTVYLPARLLDEAEAQAARAGEESVQAYCERLLTEAIGARRATEAIERRGALAGLDAIADDPEYLLEWTASIGTRDGATGGPASGPALARSLAAATILRHAGIEGDDPSGFLASMRRVEATRPDAAAELLRALGALEGEHGRERGIDRRLAYALHRLAFEGQILFSEAWQGGGDASATLELLRIVQESVDRILSGEDIRYDRGGSGSIDFGA